MKQFIIRLAAFLVASTAASSGFAQDQQDCDCVLPLQTLGQVEFVRGVVRASSFSGLQPALVGTPLPNGSQLVVGPASAARADFSYECSLDLGENTELTVTEIQSQLCVRVSRRPVAAGLGPYPVIAGFAGIGYMILTGGDDSASD